MSFPTDIDTFVTPQPGQAMNNPRQTEVIGAIHDALTAVQERVGVVDSDDPESLTAQLAEKADQDHGHVLGDVEELQAFVESKDQPGGLLGINVDGTVNAIVIHRTGTAEEIDELVLAEGEIACTSDTHELRVGDGLTAGGHPISGGGGGLDSLSTIVVSANGTPTTNGTAFKAAYTAAQSLTPNGAARSATNRATVLVMPGEYHLGSGTPAFSFSANYVDVLSVGGVGTVFFSASGTDVIRWDCDEARLAGLAFRNAVSITMRENASDDTRWDNMLFLNIGPSVSVGSGSTLKGTFRNCVNTTTNLGFFGAPIIAAHTNAGTFIDCSGGGANFFGGQSLTNIQAFTGRMLRCRYTGTSGTWNARIEGTLDECDFGTLRIQRLGGVPKIRRCRFANSSGDSIGHNAAIDALIVFCLLRAAIGSNVTNLVSEGYNIVDSDI